MAYDTHLHTRHRGLVPTEQLGTGTADGTKILYGDQTWDTPPAGGVPNGGTTGQVLTKQSGADQDTDWETPTGGSSGMFDVYGDGQDGNVTINSGTFSVSVGGSALITNNQLQRDAYFNDLTLNGGDLDTRGFRVYVKGTLTLTSGVIRNNGANASNGNNGTGAAAGTGGAGATGTNSGSITSSTSGAAGRNGGFNANGVNGAGSTASIYGLGTSPNGVAGGASGQGQTGGTGGTSSAGTNTATERPSDYHHSTAFRSYAGTVFNFDFFTGSPSTSGGGAGSASSGGGGGGGCGASGGPLILWARTISGTTNIEAKGGTGGNGGNGGGTNAGGGGGGNGGNGGYICLIYGDRAGWSGSLVVTGGNGGTGGSGVGTGSSGTNGNTGRVGYSISFEVTG